MRALAWVAVVGVLLAGCAQPVNVEPAPSASTPVCADVLISLPDELAGAEVRSTTSQASRAWGEPAIVLRCGVEPLPPTTDPCVSITDGQGKSVDWVTTADGAPSASVPNASAPNATVFTSYGRDPAVEVTIPASYAGEAATTILTVLTASVAPLPQDGSCL